MKASATLEFARHFAGYLRRRSLQHLVVHVTERCNMRCSHCFVDFAARPDLDLDAFRKLARDAGRLFWLDIGGGEPFLRRDLPEIVAAFDARVVQIPTNGSLGHEIVPVVERIRATTDAELGIAVSVDGLQGTHDRLRRAPGSWEKAWDTFARLKQVPGIAVYVNTVLTAQNQHEVLDLMDEVWRRGPRFHAITLLRGEPLDASIGLPRLDALHALGPDILQRMERYRTAGGPLSARISRNYHRYLWSLSLRTLETREQAIPCLAGSAHLVVWADGRVAPCEMLPAAGNLREQSWRQILEGPALGRQMAGIRAGECACTHNCALFDSILYSPRALLRLAAGRVPMPSQARPS